MPGELSQEDIDALLAGATAQEPASKAAESPKKAKGTEAGGMPLELADMASASGGVPEAASASIDMLLDVALNVRIELGRTRMLVGDVLKLAKGAVVELDKLAGDPVDLLVNGRLIARGEILVLNDSFCVRVTEILNPKERLAASAEGQKEV